MTLPRPPYSLTVNDLIVSGNDLLSRQKNATSVACAYRLVAIRSHCCLARWWCGGKVLVRHSLAVCVFALCSFDHSFPSLTLYLVVFKFFRSFSTSLWVVFIVLLACTTAHGKSDFAGFAKLLHPVLWANTAVGCILLILTREHYSSDVFLAACLTSAFFGWWY